MPSPSLDVAPSWRLTAFPRLHRQDASNPLLQPTFRVTSTRLLRSVASGDSLPSAVGKPAGVRLRGRSGRGVATLHPGTAPDHLAVIRPPAASCLTARCRLRAVRSPRSCGARVEELRSLVSSRKLRRNRPSDTSRGAWKGTQSARFPVAWPRSSRRTSMSPALSGAEVPSVAQYQHGPPLRAVRVELCSAGRRSFRRTCSSMFENTD